MDRISTNPEKYVVFDVETNGLRSRRDDLLSISFFKPDDGKEYSRFLPLELNPKIVTTHINGITEKDLEGATALTQRDFDRLINEFELDERKILIYAGKNFDAFFLSAYLQRHGISGFEKLDFYNIKKRIISSKFADGAISKDNLCKMFKIEGVSSVHSASNDCRLEWELFRKMDGYYYLVTEGDGVNNVFRLNEDYIVPASLLYTHPNLSRVLPDRPCIDCKSEIIKTFEIDASEVEKFGTNITGMTIEHLINSMLAVNIQDSRKFLRDNKKKLKLVGKIPNHKILMPMEFNSDGTVLAIRPSDKKIERRINKTNLNLKEKIQPLVAFIRSEIFKNEPIMSQELVIDHEHNILAKCDLSSTNAVLEIKTNSYDPMAYREQLFYESNGREVYYLQMNWIKDPRTNALRKIVFNILLVEAYIDTSRSPAWTKGTKEEKRYQRAEEIKQHLSSTSLKLVSFTNISSPIKLRCTSCGYEWSIRYPALIAMSPTCPRCMPRGRM